MMRTNRRGAVPPGDPKRFPAALKFFQPFSDRLGPISPVPPKRHGRNAPATRLLVYPRGRDPEELGYLIGRQQRPAHTSKTFPHLKPFHPTDLTARVALVVPLCRRPVRSCPRRPPARGSLRCPNERGRFPSNRRTPPCPARLARALRANRSWQAAGRDHPALRSLLLSSRVIFSDVVDQGGRGRADVGPAIGPSSSRRPRRGEPHGPGARRPAPYLTRQRVHLSPL